MPTHIVFCPRCQEQRKVVAANGQKNGICPSCRLPLLLERPPTAVASKTSEDAASGKDVSSPPIPPVPYPALPRSRRNKRQRGTLASNLSLAIVLILLVVASSLGTYVFMRQNGHLSSPPKTESVASAVTSVQTNTVPNNSNPAPANPPQNTSSDASIPSSGPPNPTANAPIPSTTPDVPTLGDQSQTTMASEKVAPSSSEQQPLNSPPQNFNPVSIQLKSSKIDFVELKSTIGNRESTSIEKYLICSFLVRNQDERKIIIYSDPDVGVSHFAARDDVDNVIRGIKPSITESVVGSIRSGHDLQPGEESVIIKVFRVPPPKTKFLMVTVDMSAFSMQGQAQFKLDSSEIENFPVDSTDMGKGETR